VSARPPLIAAFAVLAVTACGEPAARITATSADGALCQALAADYPDCNVTAGFTGGLRVGMRSRLDLSQQWLAAHPDLVRSVRPSPGPESPEVMRVLCIATTSAAATETTYQAIKGFGSTAASGALVLCTDTGHSFQASDPVDHGGDEVRR
jgi:hypothetical protein